MKTFGEVIQEYTHARGITGYVKSQKKMYNIASFNQKHVYLFTINCINGHKKAYGFTNNPLTTVLVLSFLEP